MFFLSTLEKVQRFDKRQQEELFNYIDRELRIPYVKSNDGIKFFVKNNDPKNEKLNSFIDMLYAQEGENEDVPIPDQISLYTLRDKIQSLSQLEHERIFDFLRSKLVSYSQNKSGVFICLNSLSPSVLNQLVHLVNYLYTNKQELDNVNFQLTQMSKNISRPHIEPFREETDHTVTGNDIFSRKMVAPQNTRKQCKSSLGAQRQKRRNISINIAHEQQQRESAQAAKDAAAAEKVRSEIQSFVNLKKKYMRKWPEPVFDPSTSIDPADYTV